MFGNTPKVVVIEKGEPLTKEQFNSAFSVGKHSLFWRAVIQITEDHRVTASEKSYAGVDANNEMYVFASVGAQSALSTLLDDLNSRLEAAKE